MGARCDRIVVVGGGQGGFQVAASLREGGYRGNIVLVGDEFEPPYQRPPLSKAYLAGKVDAAGLHLRGPGFYEQHRLAVRPGLRAVEIDRRTARVRLASGEGLAYDHLVLATGARNRPLPMPGADLDGVLQLRTLADAAAIRARLSRVRRVAIVGAGFIGLEFASHAIGLGLEVTILEAADRPMSRSVSTATSAFFGEAHARAGVRFVYGATATEVAGVAGCATGVVTADGRHVPADLVLVGIGVLPNAELAGEAGLPIDDGVLVDDGLVTDDPDVSAIGDCARHPNPFAGGRRVRLESVQNAVDHARCVAARLVGRPAPYASLPWFWSDQGAMKLQIAGLAHPHERVVLRGDPASGAFSVFCFDGDRLVGVESVNRPADHVVARRLLGAGVPITPDAAADLSISLKDLAGARPLPA